MADEWSEQIAQQLMDARPEQLAAVTRIVERAIREAVARALEEHNAATCPEDYGCKEWIAVLTRQRDAAEDRQLERGAQLSELQGALAERDAQIAHQADVIAANQVAFDALQSVCEQRLRAKDAEIAELRARPTLAAFEKQLDTLFDGPTTPPRAPTASLTEEQVETDPRFQHLLSGDHYQRGHKDDV